ncbi:MAG: beta-galactosidase [Candidatus Hydrogenedentes bacterium]|nr:beta-galactosidase [Candidatus Hydrogenedentota bacterium]
MRRRAAAALLAVVLSGSALAATIPVCDIRTAEQRGPAILINGKPIAPLMFAANNQFGHDDVLVREIAQAGTADVNLISFNLNLDFLQSESEAAGVIARFCEANPKAYFYPRIWLGADGDWMTSHPDDCIAKADGTRLSMVSPSSESWRTAAAEALRRRIREIAAGPYGDHFIGMHLSYLQTGEWFYPETNEFMDYSPANLRAFRAWLKKKYKKDTALQSAWNDDSARIETAVFATPEERDREDWGVFRNPNRSRRSMDMQEFQAELIPDTISHFAAVVKAATQRRSLVGVFYGYTMELHENGPRALAGSGHLGLGRLLASKDIDLIHAPNSYFERKLGAPGHFHLAVDSAPLHGKLVVIEDDTYTHTTPEPDAKLKPIAPGWAERTNSIEETLAVTRRNYASILTHRAGLWYFDLLSDGRWSDPKFWESTSLLRRMAAEIRNAGPFRPEVAFAISEESVHVLKATTSPLLMESLCLWRAELDRIGTPVGYYLQSDLPGLPDSIRVLILPNAFVVRDAEREAVRKFLKKGGTVVWNYAPDVAGPEGLDTARIAAITGIQVEATLDDVSSTFMSEVSDETWSFEKKSWNPRFHITSTDVHVLARFQQNHEVCAAARPLGGGVSVYTAVPRLPVGMLRWICQQSGVQLYRNTPGMTGVVGDYLVVHTDGSGPHELRWPRECDTIERLVPFTSYPVARSTDIWADVLPGNTTALYLCTPKPKTTKPLRKNTLTLKE